MRWIRISFLQYDSIGRCQIRLQSQTRHSSTCSYFLYSNGLGDHLCQRVVNGDALRKDICSCRWYITVLNISMVHWMLLLRYLEPREFPLFGVDSLLHWFSLSSNYCLYFLTYESLRMKFISRNTFSNDNVSSGVARRHCSHMGCHIMKSDTQYSENRPPRFVDNLISGGIAGGLSSALTTPFDVIKTKRQIELGTKHTTNFAVAQRIVSENGFKGLLAGLTPRVMKVSPACAIMISSYEYCKSFFLSRHNKS
ncbi:SLC25A39_40 [Lepeophtheirus salmonis]|uniref:SLC25A39_40 n=1 Tax=Lepeophtheirus salmonis TaxID=72036 RepID=A0A7R8CI24_LEPSM|nr:SLC25A39_40 [Lepeophtheirus salmonis]CAF2828691.1 SLC25A39_40 [Lepeophtheirus salmonis]